MTGLREILEKLKNGKITITEAERNIKGLYIEEIENIASFDLFREYRTGFPEVVFGQNKDVQDIFEICSKILEKKKQIIISKLSRHKFTILKQKLESIKGEYNIVFNEKAKIAHITSEDLEITKLYGKVGIITAGTSDNEIAEEARVIIKLMGAEVITAYDVGISGFHRIFPPLKEMIKVDVDILIVIAGMEGTLPSVVASLVDIPVIGVPAPTGYGLGESGKGALTTMLQSCAPGLVVVNIGNGFGAAVISILFLKRIEKYLRKANED
ncbi:MAG: nickel pincer cofactor biosynthesis protein LarB [Candidatus Lokiarchaeota archaeon]|nr:nickel pincer cofactor biosynthesis protein LarB [Candidatus Lokiarchaeota archaeon]